MAEVDGLNRIGILGPGAIGGMLAALFCRQGRDVVCVGSAASSAAIARSGVAFESPVFGSTTVYPRAYTSLNEPVDVLFITIKAPFLLSALNAVAARSVANGIVVPLLNGIGHRLTIEQCLGGRIATGTIGNIEVAKGTDGVVRQLSRQPPHVDLAAGAHLLSSSLEPIRAVLEDAGVSVALLGSESEVVWKKLVRLNAIASATAAFQVPIGVIRSDPSLRAFLEGMVEEGAVVARQEGVAVNPVTVLAQIDSLPETLTTSLQRDVASGRPSELESITGAVLRLANTHGINVPTHERLYALICQQSAGVTRAL